MPEAVRPDGTLLAFDFGHRKIGVAVGNTVAGTARALDTIPAPGWDAIQSLIKEWRPAALVVGLPLDAEGNDTDMSRDARAFGTQLGERFERPVFYADERLTSAAARGHFADQRASGQARRKHAKRIDAMAAQMILEHWLHESGAENR